MAQNSVVLLGCGDVGAVHGPVEPLSKLIQPVLATGDLRFANCERMYSNRGTLNVHGGHHHARVKPEMASIFSDCGFDVLSVANNHAMDWGPDALLDTIELMRGKGIQTCGGGRNIEEARKPAIVERNGVTIAFLAYSSVVIQGYEATADRPGIVPLRARTSYEHVDYTPGMPPNIVTVPHEEDLRAMIADVAAVKKAADAVVVSMHWGVHFIPRVIADYQPVVAKAAFDAGADLILGHHAHIPKAVSVFGGKVCFYSLGNFIVTSPTSKSTFFRRHLITADPDYPTMNYGVDAKRSLIAKVVVSRKGIDRVSFLPVLIDKQIRPEALRHGDPRFDDAVKHMEWVSEWHDHRFSIEGDEVLVS
jgi:poly-gamma-glutamate synthesis protein (capsule biosynthesis protein)